jgi:hypothetical protein
MLRTVLERLCATRRNRMLLGVAAAIIPLVVILALLESSYQEEVAAPALTFTGSLPSSPVAPSQMQLESLALPTLAAATQPLSTEPAQRPAQRAVISRDLFPLPRSRPNRF